MLQLLLWYALSAKGLTEEVRVMNTKVLNNLTPEELRTRLVRTGQGLRFDGEVFHAGNLIDYLRRDGRDDLAIFDISTPCASLDVVVVDDCQASQEAVSAAIKRAGHQLLHGFGDAENALRSIGPREVDLLLASAVLPVCAGAERGLWKRDNLSVNDWAFQRTSALPLVVWALKNDVPIGVFGVVHDPPFEGSEGVHSALEQIKDSCGDLVPIAHYDLGMKAAWHSGRYPFSCPFKGWQMTLLTVEMQAFKHQTERVAAMKTS